VVPTQQGKHAAPRKRRRKSALSLILIDLLCIALGLNIFALFHHVIDFTPKTTGVVLPAATAAPVQETAAPAPEAQPEVSAEPLAEVTPSPEPRPLTWAEKYAEHFTDGEILQTDTSYRSPDVSVEVTTVQADGVLYHVAELWLTDVRYLRSAFGNGGYGYGTQSTANMAGSNDAIVAISGDHYTGRYEGVVIRNGILYRETRFGDVCILGYDGVMYTLTDAELDLEAIKTEGNVYQLWSFGPALLVDGQPQTEFESEVTRANPRSAIGYVEPGHYFLVQVDGRIPNSNGMTMAELSQLFYNLGCTVAYNLDGGQTAGMYWNGSLLSHPYGRDVGDIIYVAATLPEENPAA